MPITILSIGQCGFDDPRIDAMLRQHFSAQMESASSAEEARTLLAQKSYNLILVNRIFDATGESGIQFIANQKPQPNFPPLMLISNYEDAQAQAIANGALPGFGKSALTAPDSLAKITTALALTTEVSLPQSG